MSCHTCSTRAEITLEAGTEVLLVSRPRSGRHAVRLYWWEPKDVTPGARADVTLEFKWVARLKGEKTFLSEGICRTSGANTKVLYVNLARGRSIERIRSKLSPGCRG